MIATRIIMLATVFSVPVAAIAQQGAPTQGTASAAAASSYILGPNDEIEMKVFGQENMDTKTRIKADGTIIAPFLGTVTAAGKTTAELTRELGQAYLKGGYLSRPSLNIEVTSYASKTATVLGAVPNAGLYPLDQPYTVAAIVAKAGGARPDGANAVILTPAGGGTSQRISLADLAGGASRLVQPGDTLFVPNAEMVYVYGEVNKGGAFPFQPGMTYRQALALAGGPTLAGSTKRIEVRRDGKKLDDASLDAAAKPEDVLVIKEKWF